MNKSKTRCEIIGEYIVKTGTTVRDAAKQFGISKSTVHKDITQTLKRVNKPLYFQVKQILSINKHMHVSLFLRSQDIVF